MSTLQQRTFLGCVAGAIAILTFHQGTMALLHLTGMGGPAPFRTMPVPPFGLPVIVCLSFWGGVYGAIFGMALPRLRAPLWFAGLGLGLLVTLIAWFVVAPIKGKPIAFDFEPGPMIRSLLANLIWGFGVGLLLPLLAPRALRRHAIN
jgi:hypothetical protein